MKNTLKMIFLLLLFISILLYSNQSYNFKKIISSIKLKNHVSLTKYDILNLYNFLDTKYNNILLPKNIIFNEINNEFICESLKFLSDNTEYNIKIKFIPILDKSYVTKYMFFNRYGQFKILNDNNLSKNNNLENIPNITHLSSDISDEIDQSTNFNFNIDEIIDDEIIDNKNNDENTLFIKNNNNIDDNDTENLTTESLINNVIL